MRVRRVFLLGLFIYLPARLPEHLPVMREGWRGSEMPKASGFRHREERRGGRSGMVRALLVGRGLSPYLWNSTSSERW